MSTLPEAISSARPIAPLAPSPFHRWNRDTRQFEPDIEAAHAARQSEVDALGAAASVRAIEYDGALFDANALARSRISGTLSRLLRGDGLPAGWVGWRDAGNAMHWSADDAATVMAQLSGLARAIEDREQALLIAAWAHKAKLSALTDIGSILAYDITTGWLS